MTLIENDNIVDCHWDCQSNALVYAHCANRRRYGRNGTVTLFAANPSASAVTLRLSPPVPARPRLSYVLTPPRGPGGSDDLASKTPVLNGDDANPLALGADGSLPRMDGEFCGKSGNGSGSGSGSSSGSSNRSEGVSEEDKGKSKGKSRGFLECDDALTLPARSQVFFVLLGAASPACAGS